MDKWHVSEDEFCSDHNYIKFEVVLKGKKKEKILVRNLKNMDWAKFSKSCLLYTSDAADE